MPPASKPTKSLVDFFIQEDLHFRVIVVDQDKVEGNRELGFYKFYYEMLIKWLTKDNQYLILLDFKQNWLEPRTAGGWKFRTAYRAMRDKIVEYQQGRSLIKRWEGEK